MKSILGVSLIAVSALFMAQAADACPVIKQWSQQDIAFADVIFEGSLIDVEEVPSAKAAGRRSFLKFTFDVRDVVRGELEKDEIVVGWMYPNYRDLSDYNPDTLKKSIGEMTRVAITTPQLGDLFCELKLRKRKSYDKEADKMVYSESLQPICDYTVDSIKPAFIEKIPFVLSNGYICGRSYLFSVTTYEDMRNHEKNYEVYKTLRDEIRATKEGRMASFEKRATLYRELVPQGPLPWKTDSRTARSLAVHLVRYHDVFFTSELSANESWQESFVDFGVAIARDQSRSRVPWFDRDEAALLRFRDDLKGEILRLLDYMEKDPDYRNRLLLED